MRVRACVPVTVLNQLNPAVKSNQMNLRWLNQHFIDQLIVILLHDKDPIGARTHKRMLSLNNMRCKYSLKLFIIEHKMHAHIK